MQPRCLKTVGSEENEKKINLEIDFMGMKFQKRQIIKNAQKRETLRFFEDVFPDNNFHISLLKNVLSVSTLRVEILVYKDVQKLGGSCQK